MSFLAGRPVGLCELRVEQIGQTIFVFLSPVLEKRNSEEVVLFTFAAQKWPQQLCTRTEETHEEIHDETFEDTHEEIHDETTYEDIHEKNT